MTQLTNTEAQAIINELNYLTFGDVKIDGIPFRV